MPQVTGIVRTGREEPRLALLVDVEGPEALRKLIANRVKLTTGVTECQHIEQPDPAMLALFAQASA
ncbi:MAG: hypothetical protein R3185_02815 [Candidatus Thermoplasmatota archaeon]|nr:hypothetical protein [Candidatus Thermoplasmatota archaeon]